MTPSPSLPSLKRISRQPLELSRFFQDASTVRTKATIAAAKKERQNNFPMILPSRNVIYYRGKDGKIFNFFPLDMWAGLKNHLGLLFDTDDLHRTEI